MAHKIITGKLSAPLGLFAQLRVLFDRNDLWQASGLLVLMAIGATLEMIAVSLMFPLIETLANPSGEPSMPIAQAIYRLSDAEVRSHFAFWLLFLLVGFYVVKNLFFVLLFHLQNRFGFHKQGKLSNRLFAHYLSLPYTFHLQRNTADLLRNLTHETDQIVWSIAIPGLTLITETLIALGLTALLFYSSFQAAMVIISLFGCVGYLYYRFFRNSLERWGNARILHDGLRVRAIHEGLGGLKELKVLGRSNYFLHAYDTHNMRRGLFASRLNLVQGSNLLLLEVLGVSSLLVLVGLHLWQGKPFDAILPMMGVFAGAAFRLIPATNRIINNFQQIQYSGAVLRTLCEEFSYPLAPASQQPKLSKLNFHHSINIDAVSFRYAPDLSEVLHSVSLHIERGEIIGLIGRSGEGKTTLIDLLLGILEPSSGSIRIDGSEIQTSLSDWQRMIGYIPQNIYLVDGTIRQNIAFAIPNSEINDERVMAALNDAQLSTFIAILPKGIDTPVGELGKQLSGGQRQRIGIARALYHDPEILVLDEATSSLDVATETDFINTIRGMHRRKTILIITHRLSTLDCCDRIYQLKDGKLNETTDLSAQQAIQP